MWLMWLMWLTSGSFVTSDRHQNNASRWNRKHLQSLPDTDFDTSYLDIRHVSWDSYIEVGGNRYSVPENLCGQPVSIRI